VSTGSIDRQESEDRFRRAAIAKVALMLKTATIHQLGNAAFVRPIAELLDLINPFLSQGEAVRIQAVGENFFLNNELVRLDFSSYESGQTLRQLLKRVGVDEIAFLQPLSDPELRAFLQLFQRHIRSKTPTNLASEAIGKITLRRILNATNTQMVEIDERQNLLRAYVVLGLTIKNAIEDLRRGKSISVARLRRAIHGLATASLDHESLLVAMTRFPSLCGEVEFHLAGVTALVMLMGRRLSLARPALTELCLAAVLHDVGRAELPIATDDTSPSDASLVAELERVPIRSFLQVCRGNLGPEILSYASITHEHQLPLAREPSATARMIAVPCAFDLLTTPSPVRRALPPDQALQLIQEKAGKRFDPTVAALFASTVGLFPAGTAVELSSGETALVMEVPADPSAYAQPTVKVIRDARGAPADMILDLSRSTARIVRTIDAAMENINSAQFLMA
jgi:HD-GYP domain-containing protein (c-di-GMP phosphodiesterase class II)